ncbi:MAG: GAF domain-containing protein [Bacteroidales bacterium]|jgi:methyl-accepting chemotaxis protein|nr:GAF domain-containing protein [Bacteroidales bacterium]
MKIKTKLLLYILATSILIFIAIVGYITIKSQNLALTETQKVATTTAKEYANIIKSELSADFKTVKTLAQSGQAYHTLGWDEWNTVFLEQQRNVILENPHFLAVATSWELQYIDPEWEKPHGRYLNGWVREQDGNIQQLEARLNTEGDVFTSNYYKMKSSGKPMIVDPELYHYSDNEEDQYLNSNLSVPIKMGNSFIGLAGVDVDLHRFQKIIEAIKPFENSYAFLLSNNCTFVAHPDKTLMGQSMAEYNKDFFKNYSIAQKVAAGEFFSLIHQNKQKEKHFYAFAPISIDEVETPWSLVFVVPHQVITSKANRILLNALIVSLAGLLILTLVVWLIAQKITDPILKVTEILKKLSLGKIDESSMSIANTKDEVGEMMLALNTSMKGLNKKAEFAQKIGAGKIDSSLELLSNEDKLGHSLLDMRASLKKAREEEEIRKAEDQKRRWTNEGLAKFADILRQNNDNLSVLSMHVIKNLVRYLEVNQGGLFILNDQEVSDKTLDLVAAFAFDREKHFTKQVELGEGLVGTCAVEKETIHLTEIPQDYVHIVSGLGGSNPNSLLLIPLKVENDLLGVIEMASFKKFEKHEIDFAESVAESIAATLRSVQINSKTSELLEKSQQQAEEMAAQEEEMRQNMEELQATQEEAARRENDLNSVLTAIDQFLLKAELTPNGELISANKLFLTTFGYTNHEILNQSIEKLIPDEELQRFKKIWEAISKGNSHNEIFKRKSKKNETLWLITSYTPIYDEEGNLFKVLYLAIDNTKSRKEKEELKRKVAIYEQKKK